MGNVRQRGRGWEARYQVHGQAISEMIYARTKSEAIEILKQREAEALQGRIPVGTARRLRVVDLAADLENEYKAKGRRSPDTLKYRLANLNRYFGGRPAVSITTADIRAYTAQRLAEGASPGTVRAELAKLKAMFNLAIRSERLYRKPYIPLPAEGNPRQGFFEPEQFERVLAALPDYLIPVAEFGYYTGWRRSEITSLRWDQVNLREHSLRLWVGTTKNDEGRFLPLEGELWRIIEEQRKSPVVGCPLVFHRKGRRILTFYTAWSAACQKAGSPGMLFHDFRRTAARNLTREGLSEKQAMMVTGHKTREVFRRYNIVTEGDLRQALRSKAVFRAREAQSVGKKLGNRGLGGKAPGGQLRVESAG